MNNDPEFKKMISQGYRLVSVNILYYMPDQRNLVNEFMWQTLDLIPKYPRIHQFLDFWKKEIDAIIKDVQVGNSNFLEYNKWRNGIILPLSKRYHS